MAVRTRQDGTSADVLDVGEGETLTLSREDFEHAATAPRNEEDDTDAAIHGGLLGEDDAFGSAPVHRLTVNGPKGARVVIPEGAAIADGVLEARGGLLVECRDPLQEAVLHDDTMLGAPAGMRRLRALDRSRASVDLTHAPDGYAVLLADDASGLFEGGAHLHNGLVNEALKGDPDATGGRRPDPRSNDARGRVVGIDNADIVAANVPCVQLGSASDANPDDSTPHPAGAAFGNTGMILDGHAWADLYDNSTAAVYGEATATVRDDAKAVARESGRVAPGDDPSLEGRAASRWIPEGWIESRRRVRPYPGHVRLLGPWTGDPTGRFPRTDRDAVLGPWPEDDDIEIPEEKDDSPVGAEDAGKVIDGFMTLRRGDDVSLEPGDFEKAPLVRRYDDGTGPLVHELTVRGPYGSRVTVPGDAAGDDCILNVEGGVEAECHDPYLPAVVSGFATLRAPEGMYDLTALESSAVFIDQSRVADGYAVLVADHAAGVVDGGMREDSDLMERAREGEFGPFPSGQVVGLGAHAAIVADDVPAVHLWQGARGAAFGHTGMVLEQGSQADLYGRSTAVARDSSKARLQDDARVLAMDGAAVSAGDGPALSGVSAWFDRAVRDGYPRTPHHAPAAGNVHLSGEASLDTAGFRPADPADGEASGKRSSPARHWPSTAMRIMAEAPRQAGGPQDGLSR